MGTLLHVAPNTHRHWYDTLTKRLARPSTGLNQTILNITQNDDLGLLIGLINSLFLG
jgi:hypothetical protein